jgi:hypothetical protein
MWMYLLGVVTAPLLAPVVKPVFRGLVKSTILLGDEIKKVADSVREDIGDIAAETRQKKAGDQATVINP